MSAPVIVSICALAFTVVSFWWIQARRGRLKGYPPHSFAAAIDGSAVLLLRFPLIIHNTGAIPIVILDMRLRFPDEPASVIPLPWRAVRSQLMPTSNDGLQLPAAFAVPARTAQQHFQEFGGPWPGIVLKEDGQYRVVIEAKVDHSLKWVTLVDFQLILGKITSPGQFIAYSNSPWVPTAEDKKKIDAMNQQILRMVKQTLTPIIEVAPAAVEPAEEGTTEDS
jgi:hypothetical protein